MASSDPGAPTAPERAGAPWRILRAALPHILTAAAAVAITLGLQVLLRPAAPPPPAMPVTGQPTLPPTASPPPTPTPLPLAEGVSRQELLDLRAEDDRIWAVIYLMRALDQLVDAEAALRINDLARVDQGLIAVDDSLALAATHADATARDPIEQLRRDAGSMREDLYLRPEGMDLRLFQLRQTLLALIGEPR